MDVYSMVNRLLNARGNILRILYDVDGRGFQAYVYDNELWGAVKDILLNREYEYVPGFEIHTLRGATVLDIGANVGLYSLTVSPYARRIIAVEPHPVNFKLLEINRMINGVGNIELVNAAVTGRGVEEARICEASHSGGARVGVGSGGRCWEARAIVLEELLEAVRGSGEVFIKMDIEGSEFDVIKSVDRSLMKDVSRIVMEVHADAGPIEWMAAAMRDLGFRVEYYHPPITSRAARPRIRVRGLYRLKIARMAVYTAASLLGAADRALAILFAYRG